MHIGSYVWKFSCCTSITVMMTHVNNILDKNQKKFPDPSKQIRHLGFHFTCHYSGDDTKSSWIKDIRYKHKRTFI